MDSQNSTAWPQFLSIRKASHASGLPEHTLRVLVKQGRCPGFYTGSWFLVNLTALRELLSTGGIS